MRSYAIVQAVAEQRVKLGVVADTVDLRELQSLSICSDQLVLLAPREHPLIGRTEVGFGEVLDYPLVGLIDDSALQMHLATHASRLGRKMNYRVKLRSFDAICGMVARGVGIAIVPESVARRRESTAAVRFCRHERTLDDALSAALCSTLRGSYASR